MEDKRNEGIGMEEIKENDVQKKENHNEIRISLSGKFVGCFFAICAILLLTVAKIVLNFASWQTAQGRRIFVGVMSIFIYSLAVGGVLWNLYKNKKLSFDLIFSSVVAFLVFLTF